MGRRWATTGLLASLAMVTGCATAISSAAPTHPAGPARPASTSTSTTLEVSTTSTTALPPVTTTSSTPGPSASALVQALGQTWSRTPPSSCLMVTDGSAVLFERNPDVAVVPASTMKLLTATAVLARLDPNARLRTPVLAAAPPDADGIVHGDVWLVGGGDPVLGTLAYGAHFTRRPRLLTAIEVLADRLKAAGVRQITGGIVGDDGRFSRQRYVPSWPSQYARDGETGPLSALSVNDAFLEWTGFRAVGFLDPAAGAAGVLNELLRQRGIAVGGVPASGAFPKDAVELAAIQSPTIAELVDEMLLDSNNNAAELLLRELGLEVLGTGSTDAGRLVVAETLSRMGLPMEGVHLVDGSGLDRGVRITCRLLVAILTSSPSRGIVTKGLPVAAQTGTLYKRFLGTPVAGHLRAKTGSLDGVASLAGYADGPGGPTLTFAYVQNGVTARRGAELQDELGRDLVLTAGG